MNYIFILELTTRIPESNNTIENNLTPENNPH